MSVLSHAILSQLQAALYPLMLYTVNRVRHEAGEALGAIGTATCLKELQQYLQDPCLEVRLHSTSVRMLIEPSLLDTTLRVFNACLQLPRCMLSYC